MNSTDVVDNETLEEMERPRCSRPDLDLDLEEDPGHRQKRYQYLNQAKYLWGQNGLRMPVTVGFTNYWPGMSQSDQEWVALQCASVSTAVLAIPSLIQLISIKYNMLYVNEGKTTSLTLPYLVIYRKELQFFMSKMVCLKMTYIMAAAFIIET